MTFPQAQTIFAASYFGCIPSFICRSTLSRAKVYSTHPPVSQGEASPRLLAARKTSTRQRAYGGDGTPPTLVQSLALLRSHVWPKDAVLPARPFQMTLRLPQTPAQAGE